jgi:hypothetical protein
VHFQKQLRLFEQTCSDLRRGLTPGGIQLPGLPAGELVPRKGRSHLLAVFQAATRHRHQVLHRYLRGDLARSYLLLHALRQKLHQGQATGHPTHTAIELPSQFLQLIPEALLQLAEQPAFFQGTLAFRPVQRAIQHQSLHFVEWPDHCLDRVSAELFESGHALEAIDEHITIRLIGDRDDHDRSLLSATRQRRQQLSLPMGIPHAQMFMPAVQLVKLQLHAQTVPQAASGIVPGKGEVCRKPLSNQ